MTGSGRGTPKNFPALHTENLPLEILATPLGPECQLWQNLLQELLTRFRLIEMVYLIAAGTLLDPQFKKVAFVNRSAVKQAIRRIKGKVA